MSSHHIVREDQEPALLIADAHAIPFEILQQLLEWSPTVLVTEKAIQEVLTWGIKIDVVIAPAANISNLTQELHDQFPLKLISCQGGDDAIATALYFLIAAKQKAVNIVSSERLENFESFAKLDLSVLQSDKRWSFIRSGMYQKWLPAGRTLQFYPSNGQPEMILERDQLISINRSNGFWIGEING
jgi:thiamine pyrophosphokinase